MKPLRSILFFTVIQAASLMATSCAFAQRTGATPQTPRIAQPDAATGMADLVIAIRDDTNSELAQPAKVTLRSRSGDTRGVTISEKGRARFRGVPIGDYEVQVDAPGYTTTKANVSLDRPGESHNLEIALLPSALAGANTPPGLSLKEQKELTAGLRALQAQKLDEARKHFLIAAKTAPNHPDVDYLLGVLSTMTGDMSAAKQYLENGATRYQHVLSLTALGEIYLNEGNLALAQQRLEAALKTAPNTWRAEQLLAAVELKQGSYPLAIQHAEHALQVGKTEAKGARLTLAHALYATGDYQRSVHVLNDLLKENPTQEQTKQANKLLEANREAQAPPSPAKDTQTSNLSNAAFAVAPSLSAANLPSALASPLTASPHWFPSNVDDSIPPVENTGSCPLSQVVQQTGQRVLEFVSNVDRFTATESLSHQTLNEFGLAVRSERIKFNYLVSIQEMKPGVFDVQEFRDGGTSNEIFPEHVATLGTVAMVFVFHPNYVGDFDFRCEGRAHQGNQEAWQIHFSQKADRASRLRSYRLGNQYFRVGIKGRAWISTETSQVLRMETDLVSKVPEIRLNAEHQDILYGPVPFQKKHLVLWLPLATETYLDFNGHRIHRRQDLSNYLLFWIDDRQTIEKPKTTEGPQESSPGS